MKMVRVSLFLVAIATVSLAQRAAAVDLKVGDEKTFIKFGLLLTPWAACE